MYGLSQEDQRIQARAREFADELIPYEEQAEESGGELPADLTAAHAKRARELGLASTNMPPELGGGGCTSLQQVLVQEQVGRVTNALAWVATTPPSWLPAVATPGQIERYVRPTVEGGREECYAITEEGAGSDVDAIQATAYRDGDDYVLDGVKWHVTSYNTADYAFFQARLRGGPHDGEHAMFLVDLPSPGVRVVGTPAYSHTISHHHPIVAFEQVRVPPPTWSAPRATGWPSRTSGSGSSGSWWPPAASGAAGRLTEEMTAFAAARRCRRRADQRDRPGGRHAADSLTELSRPGPWRTRPRAASTGIDTKVSTPSARWPSLLLRRSQAGSRTGPSRSSAVAATCARTWPSASSASCAWSGSGKAPARSSG